MPMTRRDFLKSVSLAVAGGAALVAVSGGCMAPHVSQSVSQSKAQPWRCGYCGHLTRSDQDLTETRCPRCKRKGHMTRITEEQLQSYLK